MSTTSAISENHISSICQPGATRIRVRLKGGRMVTGTYHAFDTHRNQAEIKMDDGSHRLCHITEADIVKGETLVGTLPINLSPFTVAERFEFLEELTDMVVTDTSKALLITGSPGLGKTHTVTARLKLANLREKTFEDCAAPGEDAEDGADNGNFDYVSVKGHSTPKSLYRALYENNGKIIVFDDCDSIFRNETAVNILKAGLDSYEKRVISWLSEKDDGLPKFFEFTGRIIFISNMDIRSIEDAIRSRSLFVDLTMTTDEKIERLRQIAKFVCPEVSSDIKDECVELISKYRNSVNSLNIRTLIKVVQIRTSAESLTNWKRLAIYSITSG